MTTHRSWFPFILVGLSAALLALILVVYSPSETPTPDEPPVVSLTGTEYEAAVHTIMQNAALSSGPQTASAQGAYEALLELRVPAAYKDVHIQLVLAYGQMAAGEESLARARMIAVQEANPWILGL